MSTQNYERMLWSYKPKEQQPGLLCLDERDLDHLVRIHNRYAVEPESVNEVTVEFLVDREPLIRYLIKESDLLLRPSGHLNILASHVESHGVEVRSIGQIMYEVSVSTNGRYVLESKAIDGQVCRLRYRKARRVLEDDDRISRWSFGIISDGRNVAGVQRLIDSIAAQGIDEYEILVCGPPLDGAVSRGNVDMLPDVCQTDDIRAPICAKKNRIIRQSRYNNLCVMHDHFELPAGWYERMQRYGNYFELLNMRNQSSRGARVIEGAEFRGRPGEVFGRRVGLLPLGQWSKDYFPGGGVIIAKKHLTAGFLFDERLHWGEMEDVQLAQMAYLQGLFCYFDPDNFIVTFSLRHKEMEEFPGSIWRRAHRAVYWVYEMALQRGVHRKNVSRVKASKPGS